jgi:hypothetical protein
MSVHISKFSLYFISLNQTKEKKILFAFADRFSDIKSRVILYHFSPHTLSNPALNIFHFTKDTILQNVLYTCVFRCILNCQIYFFGACAIVTVLAQKITSPIFLFHFNSFLKKKKNQFWLSYNPFFTRLSGSVDFHVQKSGLQQQNILRVVIPFDNGGKFKPV